MQPLGYYGLDRTEQIDLELQALDCSQLWDLALCISLWAVENTPSNEDYSVETYEWLDNLSESQLCSLLKWCGDRIEIKLMEQAK